MKWDHITVARRLGLAFAVLLLLLITSVGLGWRALAELNSATQQIVIQDWPKAKLVTTALDNTRGSIARVFQAANDGSGAGQQKASERFQANLAAVDKALQQLAPLLDQPEGRGLHAKAVDSVKRYRALAEQVFSLIAAGDRQAANVLAFGDTYNALHQLAGVLRELNEMQQKVIEAEGAEAAAMFRSASRSLGLVTLVSLALGALLAWGVTRSITRQLGGEPQQAVAVARRIAQGDLAFTVPLRAGDHTSLMASLQAMREELGRVVGEVRGNAEGVSSASTQIAQGNADLSQRTEQQASALQQAAATMEQLGTTVSHNSDNARQANQLAQGAAQLAQQGGEAVEGLVSTMQGISDASRRVSEIIGTVDGIAFQTNILALNAAVEAARAGEQGRGFAVVAAEVRTLAQRSAEAARQIKALIAESATRVDQGADRVTEAGRTIGQAVQAIHRVAGIVGEISAAVAQQSSGVHQVGQAVGQLDQLTQRNAALVEESAAASESLREQARLLADGVARFRLAGGATTGLSGTAA
jgi:methyl-accepting chemotaxis protein